MTSRAGRGIELSREENRQFGQMLGLSVGAHALLMGLFSLWQFVYPHEPLIKIPDAIEVNLLAVPSPDSAPKKSSRLPNKATFVPPPPEPDAPQEPVDATKPAATPKPEDKVVAKATPPSEAKSIQEAMRKDPTPAPDDAANAGLDEEARLAMARAMARMRARDRVAKLEGDPGLRNRDATASDGSSTGGRGVAGGINAGADSAWGTAINDRISPHWITLPTLSNKNIQVHVYVKVDTEGALREVGVDSSSGNSSFDNAAVRAVKKAAPLPLPEKSDVRTAVLTDGFILVFNPKGLTQ